MTILETPTLWLRTICRKNGLVVSDDQFRLLQEFVDHLLQWNRKINLISRQDEDLVWQNHILHSVSMLFKLRLPQSSAIMDLGTGGGLPGIPLKILLPEAEFLLLDSTRKKITAVQEMIRKLGLRGIEAVWGRAEDIARQKNLLSHFDYIVARAVAPLADLVTWSRPFLRTPSSQIQNEEALRPPPPAMIVFKGGDLEDEITLAKRKEKFRSVDVVDLVFPGSEEISSSGKKLVVLKL